MKKLFQLLMLVCVVQILQSCEQEHKIKCDKAMPALLSKKLEGLALKNGENTVVLDSTVTLKLTVVKNEITQMEWQLAGERPVVMMKPKGPAQEDPPRNCLQEQQDCKRQKCLMHPDTGEPDCGLKEEADCFMYYLRCRQAGGTGYFGVTML